MGTGGGRAHWRRGGSLLLAVALLAMTGDRVAAQFFPSAEPRQADIQFGCEPGPVEPFDHADPPVMSPPVASPRDTLRTATLQVDTSAGHQVDGHGFNLEHTLWSCRDFRRVLGRSLLTTFQPDIARVDSGQLPFAPEDAPASALNAEVYQSVMDDPKYQPGWAMLRLLNKQNVRLMLGVWGGPGQFTDDGTRRGELLPQYVDAYVEYVTAVVDYLVRRQNVTIWSVTVANEPDGGDGTLIPPDLYVEVARKLGPKLEPYGVNLNGPDTASAANAVPYVDQILDDPDVIHYFGAISTHEYFTDNAMASLVQKVREARPGLPVYATEYTSFRFGAMDRGQEATNEIGHMIDSLQVYASLMNAGADAAIYWDAVDYYQAGHAAVTRWGLLQGPAEAFAPRTRYYGFSQILPYIQAGSVILPATLSGPNRLATLAIGGGTRRPGDLAIAALNRAGPVEMTLTIDGPAPPTFEVWVTDVDRDFEHMGRVSVRDGRVTVTVPARSVTTLTASPPPDEDLGE
jgi:O-glycosyl hydrolase